MEKSPILVIDDEPSYLDLMKGLLNDEGFINVLTEVNPLNVLPLLQRTDIDLILLDIFMPEMNGLELLEKIYAEYPEIPVIVITAVNEVQIAGGYGVPVDIQLSSGVYFYKMVYVNKKGEMQIDTKKMIVLK